ncbi:hypothetical protein [Mycolicibacterium aromaticivorans]|nr:hypothetical protein [Mycolicibacterium aromaticivorans]
MTSASNHPAAMPTDAAARIDAVAGRIATDWGHHGHTALTTMIAELYTDLAVLPTRYTPQQRAEMIVEAAHTTTSELTTLLDDYLYCEADRPPVTDYGWIMHTEDRHHSITAMLGSISLTVFPAFFISRFRLPGIGRRR